MGIDSISLRLRQAITLNDLALVQRILKSNRKLLYNPSYNEKSDTSLHIAASLGFTEIVRHLISLGHDARSPPSDEVCKSANLNHGTSFNTDRQTPLHLAAANLHTSVVELLCETFPTTINRRDKEGRTPLLLAAGAHARPASTIQTTYLLKPVVNASEDVSTISVLLEHGADVKAKDFRGNTCLHNACAFGNLKAIRALIDAGADPTYENFEGWKPELYSLTVQAEVYYRNLVNESGKRLAEEARFMVNRQAKGAGGLRLVANEDNEDEEDTDGSDSHFGRTRADSGRSESTFESAMS